MIHGRFGIATAFDLMRVAVAIFARSSGAFSTLAGPGMRRMRVSRLGIGVTPGAAHLLRRLLMHQALHVVVAVHARKHASVHRALELVLIDKEAHRRAIRVRRGQRGVGVTGEAVCVLELLRGKCVGGPGKKYKKQRREPEKPYGFHTLRRCRCEISCRDWSHRGSSQLVASSL